MIVIDARLIRGLLKENPDIPEEALERVFQLTDDEVEAAVENNIPDAFWNIVYEAVWDGLSDLMK